MTTDGITILKAKLKTLPTGPGVYRMLNEAGEVLYVGKAKNLKHRLTNYTQPERLSTRIRKMVFETRELLIVETHTEAEALLLEANLIKSLKPKYNVIFRDDASYISVVITQEETPMIRHHRGAKQQKGEYFGPYPSADAVYRTLDLMERAFRLRTCKASVFKHRTRPCLKYDIKRCSAPCVGKISPENYAELVQEAKLFLRGKGDQVHKMIAARMETASEKMDYETAAVERDRLQALATVTNNRTALTHALPNADVFGLYVQGGKACIQAFYYRNGQHVGNANYFPRGVEELDEGEIFRLFLSLHYTNRQPQTVVVTSHAVAESETVLEALSQTAQSKVMLMTPQRGEKRKIMQQAQKNAEATLKRQLAESSQWGEQLQGFGKLLNLTGAIQRIEAFDISNISGKQAVASLVVAGPEGMEKNQYRKFSMMVKDTPDDYAMMKEALTRRYTRLIKENSSLPEVILVDGGVGHLNVLVEVAAELGLTDLPNPPALTAIAKGEERDKGLEKIFQWREGEINQLAVPHHTPLIFLLQRVRDEAHRFAIGFHRQKRSKNLTSSVLDSIPGIGGKRKKALLLHFGSVDGVKQAAVEDLARVDGINTQLAEDIYSWFRS